MRLLKKITSLSQLLVITIIIIIMFGSCTPVSKKKSLRIAAAASTQYVLEALIDAYTSKNIAQKEVQIESVISSSGKLTAQIEHGAPIDIFLSADTLYPNYLFQKGMSVEKPIVYAYGQLVLWTFGGYDLTKGLAILEDINIQKIALADPKTAPYGTLSQAYLKQKKLYKVLENKLILGESIGQVNQYITTQAVAIGFTAKSVVMAPKLKGKGQFLELENAILGQSMLLLKKGSASELAVDFYAFLQSPEAQKIFEEYGYISNLSKNHKLK
jgi:molybdate transport system substrate-binding protein